jgi:hypothetical protein
MRLRRLAVSFLALAFARVGQSGRGSITGVIADLAGAVVPTAAVEARNTAAGGVASESVTVNEAAPLLKTESGELSHNVTAVISFA